MIEKKEAVIEAEILAWLKKRPELCLAFKVRSVGTYDEKRKVYRTNPQFRKGCPDILCCFQGRFIGFEVKTKKGRVSEHQSSFHEDIKKHHGLVYVVRDVSDLPLIFRSLIGSRTGLSDNTSIADPGLASKTNA